jgi:hypothetical protein
MIKRVKSIYRSKYRCIILAIFFFVHYSCGYSLIGSKYLPFDSVTIKPVINNTYEPLLEDSLHSALSREFIVQGIDLVTADGDIIIEAVITGFDLSAIGAVDERVKEQAIAMIVDIRIIEDGKVTEFKGLGSPISITFQSEGSVTDAAAGKERAIDKTSAEIAKEVVSKIVLKYAK